MRSQSKVRLPLIALISAMALLTVLRASADEGLSTPAGPVETPEPGAERSWTRDEELYLLEAEQAQLALDQAEAEMEDARIELEEIQMLFGEKLVTVDKLNQAKQSHERAKLAYQQAKIDLKMKRLEFLKDATLITVVDAKKYRGEEGEVIASITLRNDSDINKARIAMAGGEVLSDDRLEALLKVHNVVVTLKGEAQVTAGSDEEGRRFSSGKAIVGNPFQLIVPALDYGEEKVLEYTLLKKDIENVTVSLELLGTQKDYDVFLRKESQQDLPVISSTQYSQIGQLGSKIKYDLGLERLAKTEQGFPLVVLNLPEEIKAAFLDPSTEAMLTQVKFTEELSKQSLYFEASIPEKLSLDLVDSTISFYIMVTQQTELKKIFEVKTKHEGKIPPEEMAKLKGNKVELILIPRGVGKLEIMVPNLFKEVEQGEPVSIKFNVMNSGTLVLRRVAATLDLPLDWEGEVVPGEAEVIDGGAKALYTANVRPPEDVAVGEYMVRMHAEGHSGMEIVEAVYKDLTVRVASKTSITGTAVLVTILVLLVLGIALASIKISRR